MAGRFSASSAAMAAISSMRLLVVAPSPPLSSRSCGPARSTAPQPPGPGLPLQAPSVKMSTVVVKEAESPTLTRPRKGGGNRKRSRPSGFGSRGQAQAQRRGIEAIAAGAGDSGVEAQLAQILHRILRLHEGAGRVIQPVIEAGQQEAHRAAAGEQREGRIFCRRQRPHLAIAGDEVAGLGRIEGVVRLEAPGVQADGDVIGVEIRAGEVEVDYPGEPVAEKEDIVGKEIGMDGADGEIPGPAGLQKIELAGELLRQAWLDLLRPRP